MTRSAGLAAVLAALALVTAACSAAPATPAPEEAVEVFTLYRGADADAFRAVLDDFTERTGIAARHVGTAAFADRLRQRVRDGDPPDVALFPQPSIVREFARSGHLAAIEGRLPTAGDTFAPGAAEVGVIDGQRFGVWYRAVVKSLVWYPPAAFADAGYAVPRTWNEMLALTRRVAAAGPPPWCVGMESFGATGWVGSDWVEDIVLRRHGPRVYDAWTDGAVAFTDPRIAGAFREFGDIALTEGRVAGGVTAILSVPALDAILPMFDDPPGCLLSRQGSFQQSALPDDVVVGPDGDVDVFPLPPMRGDTAPLVAAGEIAAAFDDGADASALVRHLSTPQAGVPWAERGGFVSPHEAFDQSAYGQAFDRRVAALLEQAPVVRFDASDQMPPDVGTGTFWDGMVRYVGGTPLPDVLEFVQSGYAELPDPG